MYKLIFSIAFLFLSISSFSQSAKQEEVCYNPNLVKDTTKKSIKSMAAGRIGKDSVKIAYHSPGVRGRIIWGGLVPLNEVWVTGAHDATHIVIDKDFMMGGKKIPAGKYALFTIPGKESWTIILNKQWNQHLTNEYDAKEDLVRIQVKPQPNAHTERLQYFIEPLTESKGNVAIAWEKIKVTFPIQLTD